ncbi:diaminopimelate dehydrogenase [Thermococcus sp.]|uniref:diaminopimelate dehydrogenase n=1 Tax=Thermococcus sp. TaxID=35749 RepID=UPI00261DE931|nr:diaminopimelate dehydrogenase [Thermococcus sp.]MCD6144322.1 diaminopimelate dehydrogenase [Thermococcus sp.]
MSKKIKIGIIGFGNVGQYAYLGVEEQKDMEVRGIFVRDVQKYKEKYMQSYPKACELMYSLTEIPSLKEELDVCLLCIPSRSVPETTFSLLKLGINTTDSYDIHNKIWEYKEKATSIAKENNSVAIISAGWDPGTDSVIRFLMELIAPNGITFTNFGPGMSMGHSTALKAFEEVIDAVSYTIPKGNGLHMRLVYILPKENADRKTLEQKIKQDPYFIHDETHVKFVSTYEELERVKSEGHGVLLERYGKTIGSPNQVLKFNMKVNNPATTAQVMVSSARSTMKLPPGAYTLLEIPLITLVDSLPEEVIKRLY